MPTFEIGFLEPNIEPLRVVADKYVNESYGQSGISIKMISFTKGKDEIVARIERSSIRYIVNQDLNDNPSTRPPVAVT